MVLLLDLRPELGAAASAAVREDLAGGEPAAEHTTNGVKITLAFSPLKWIIRLGKIKRPTRPECKLRKDLILPELK